MTATLQLGELDALFRRTHVNSEPVKILQAGRTQTNTTCQNIMMDKASKKEEAEAVVLEVVEQKARQYHDGNVAI